MKSFFNKIIECFLEFVYNPIGHLFYLLVIPFIGYVVVENVVPVMLQAYFLAWGGFMVITIALVVYQIVDFVKFFKQDQ